MIDLFKSLRIYTVRTDVLEELDAQALHDAMQDKLFKPCAAQQQQSIGWQPILAGNKMVMQARMQGKMHYLISLRIEEKLLPPKVVKEYSDAKVEAIEEAEGRKVGRKERSQIKEEVILSLLPKAFSVSHSVFAWIDVAAGRIVLSETSNKKAELLLNLLRETIGSLPAVPLATNESFASKTTSWLKMEEDPSNLLVGNKATFMCADDNTNTVAVKNQEFTSQSVKALVEEEGKIVKKIQLKAEDASIECEINEDLCISGIKIDPDLMLEIDEALGESDDLEAYKEASFNMMVQGYSQFINIMLDNFGGVLDHSTESSEEQ